MFSQKLIEDYKNYFKKRYNKDFSDEEAEDHLNNLADYFLAFYEIERDKQEGEKTKVKF